MIFILTLYSLYTQVMLIFILIDVLYLQNVVFSFEKESNGQNHFLSDSQIRIKKFPPAKFFIPPLGDYTLPLNTIWKTLPVVTYEQNFVEHS